MYIRCWVAHQLEYSQPPLNRTHPFCPKNIRMCRGTGLANSAQNVHAHDTSKCMIFCTHLWRIHACMAEASTGTKTSPNLPHRYECAANCKHVLLLAKTWRQKTRQKVAILPDKVEHFKHTFDSWSPESTPVCGSWNADNMYVNCTVRFRYARLCTGLPGCG